MSTVSRAERRRAAAAAAEAGSRRTLGADVAAGVLLAAALGLLGWLVARGPLVAPISLYAAASSTNGFSSASHIVAAAAVLGVAAALVALGRGRLALPSAGWLAGVGLPLLGAALSTARSVYPHDARYDLAVLVAAGVFAVAAASLLGGAGGGAAAAPRGGEQGGHRVRGADRGERGAGGGEWGAGGGGQGQAAGVPGTAVPAAAGLGPEVDPAAPASGAAGELQTGPRSGGQEGRASPSRGAESRTAPVGNLAAGGLPLRLALLGTVLGGCLPAGLALAQFASGRPTPVAWTGPAAAVIPVRAAATLHNPNVLAAVLLLCVGCSLALALGGRARAVRVAALAAAALQTAALALTFSRAAYLGLGVAVLAVVLLAPRERRLRALGAAGLLAATWLLVSERVPGILLRARAMGVASAGDTASRFFTWIDALRMWWAHPWTGAGPGGLEALYAVLAPLGWHGSYVFTVVPSSADNDLLEWLAETGAVGLALLAAGAVVLAVALGRAARRRGIDDRCLALPLAAALVGIAVQGGFEVTAYVLPVMFLGAWVLALLTASCGCLASRRVRGPAALAPLAAAAACAVLALTLWGAWPRYAAYRAGYAPWSGGHPVAALPALEAAARADPSSERAQGAAADAAVLALYQGGVATARPAPAGAAGSATAGASSAGTPPPVTAWRVAARLHLDAALALDPYDGAVWSVAAAYLGRLGPGASLAAACAGQAAVHTRPYDPFLAYELAQRFRTAGLEAAAQADSAYAAWVFPLTLGVMREYGQTGGEYRQGQAEMRAGLAGWPAGAGPVPRVPAEPLAASACSGPLERYGLSAAAFGAAMHAGDQPIPRAGPLGTVVRFLERGRRLSAAGGA